MMRRVGHMRPSLRVATSLAAAIAATAAQADDQAECRDGIVRLRTQVQEQRSSKERENLQMTLRKAEGRVVKRRYVSASKRFAA